MSAPTPKSLMEVIDEISAAAPANRTVRKLHELDEHGMDRYPERIIELKKLLDKELHMNQFISLVPNARQANTAVVLYAGDGIVLKITDSSFLPEKFLPCQLPPLRRYYVNGFTVEAFPWLDTRAITKKDVEAMRTELGTYGFSFSAGDDRPENLGRLPGGECAILDGDAIKFTLQEREMMDVNRWMYKIFKIFDPLYTAEPINGKEIPLVSDAPDFHLNFHPLVEHKSRIKHIDNAQEVASVPQSWLQRIRNWSSSSRQQEGRQ